jgi:hypothetical protein
VRGLFIALGYPLAAATALALLCTEYDREAFDREGTRYSISIGPRLVMESPPERGLLGHCTDEQLSHAGVHTSALLLLRARRTEDALQQALTNFRRKLPIMCWTCGRAMRLPCPCFTLSRCCLGF